MESLAILREEMIESVPWSMFETSQSAFCKAEYLERAIYLIGAWPSCLGNGKALR
jgi:hypothetical protein